MGKYSQYTEIDPEFKAIQPDVDGMIDGFWALPLSEMIEASYQDLPLPDDIPKIPQDIQTEDIEIPMRDGHKIEARVYKTKDTPSNAILNISYHGGGWTTGKHTYEEQTNRYIAFDKRAVVLSPLYRQSPDHPFPFPFEDSADTLKWAVANGKHLGADPQRIILSGSSAGGNLTAAITLYARDEGIPGVIGQLLNIPGVCYPAFYPEGFEHSSLKENKDASVLNLEQLMFFWHSYLGKDPNTDSRHSPLLATSLKGLPPTLVQVAGMDPLRDEGIGYAEELKAAGNKVQLEVFKGVPHGFGNMFALSAGRRYQQNCVAFVKAIDEGTFSGNS